MEVKPPSEISPMNKKLITKIFFQWKKYSYEINPLNIILTENNIFIHKINSIPKNFCGDCKIYNEFGNLEYDGGYMFQKFHGYGRLIINQDQFYEGEFVNNEYNGKGTYHWKKEKLKYIGYWMDSIRNGEGKEYQNDLLIYNGMWKGNIRNGIGQEYENGNLIFDGIWKRDKRNGYGKEYDECNVVIREGIWENNNFIKEITDAELCIICFQEKRNIAFLPCGHFCICQTCSQKYKDKKCLVCREKYKKIQKIFM